MAKKFLTDIDLSYNELLSAVFQGVAALPASGVKAGQFIYLTTNHILYQWNGSQWDQVGRIYVQGNGIIINGLTVSADFATTAEGTAGTSTAKVMSPKTTKDAVEAAVGALDVSDYAQAAIGESGGQIVIYGTKETDGKVGKSTSSQLVVVVDGSHKYSSSNPLATVGTVTAAQQAATNAGAVTIEAGSETAANFISYTVKQGGVTVGTINMPKHLIVKSGAVVTGTWNGTAFTPDTTQPGSGTGKALKLVLNDGPDNDTGDDTLYINVADLVDVYTAGIGIAVTKANQIKVKLKSETAYTQRSETPTNTAGRQYALGVDADGNLSVNVPWHDTTYTNAALGQGYGTCATAEATVAKAVTLSDYALVTGGVVAVKFTYAVPANATMNVNSKGAKDVYHKGAAILGGVILAGDTAVFMYDGTQYHLLATDRILNGSFVGMSVSGNVLTITIGDGTTFTLTLPTATQSAAGAMSAADKKKLDGIAAGANAYTHPSYAARTGKPTANQTPAFGGTFTVSQVASDDTGHVISMAERTVTIPSDTATKNAPGLMSASDKTKLDKLESPAQKYKVTNPALTASGGICTWTIANTNFGGNDSTTAVCSLRDSSGNEVVADIKYSGDHIEVTINSANNISAGTYTAVIIA